MYNIILVRVFLKERTGFHKSWKLVILYIAMYISDTSVINSY